MGHWVREWTGADISGFDTTREKNYDRLQLFVNCKNIMDRIDLRFLMQWPKKVAGYSVGLFYGQWTHRYLLYLLACLLIGIWTHIGLDIYGWLTWRDSPLSFRSNYILQTMMNFGICLYLADEWLMRLTGQWGRFENRTLGKQALAWGASFAAAFYIQRTLVFEGMKYYALYLYHYYEKFPRMRPRPLEHLLFCLPFLIGTILLLWLVAVVRQRGLVEEAQVPPAPFHSPSQKRAEEKTQQREAAGGTAPLCVSSGSSQLILDQDTISHITVEDHYCRIHTREEDGAKSYFVKSSLTDLLERLSDSLFVQIHRSHVVNARAVRRLDKKNRACRVYLKSDEVLPVSRHRVNEVWPQIQSMLEPSEDPL